MERKYNKEYYENNKEKFLEWQRTYRASHPEARRTEARLAYGKRRNRQLRFDAIDAYGEICACCGEDNKWFLCLDHIFDDGAASRKEKGSGTAYFNYLKKNNYPESENLQVLCFNCNNAKRVHGVCVHQWDDPYKCD